MGVPTNVTEDTNAVPASKETSVHKQYWAVDSKNGELDPNLKMAQLAAMKDFDTQDELEEPILLKGLLSKSQIAEILKEASAEDVWPRGKETSQNKSIAGETLRDRGSTTTNDDLSNVPHHFAWTNEHVVLYMHNNNHWFVRTLPAAWGLIRGGMESRKWMNGAVPVLDAGFLGVDTESMLQVRTVELHHYAAGGGLVDPGHRDCGSELTLSVLLSDPEHVSGGDFVTYREGKAYAHKMERGDAILFNSQKLHNISTVNSGLRKSLVVELWPSKRY